MNRTFENETDLVQAIGNLPKSISPAQDLWPSIEDRLGEQGQIEPRRFNFRRYAIAASVIMAFAAGLIIGQRNDQAPQFIGTDSIDLAMQAALQASELEYQAAFKAFAPVGIDQAYLESDAAAGLESSWADLQQAEASLVIALQEHPENRFLSQRLLDLRAQQLEFIRQIYMLDQNSRRKI